jgi:hypothetical protein
MRPSNPHTIAIGELSDAGALPPPSIIPTVRTNRSDAVTAQLSGAECSRASASRAERLSVCEM